MGAKMLYFSILGTPQKATSNFGQVPYAAASTQASMSVSLAMTRLGN